MNFFQSLSFTETDQLVALAPIVEEVGFHGAFVSDHLFHPERFVSKYPYSEDGVPPFAADTEFPEPWSAISAMAAVTSKLVFSTAVYIAPLRHPLEVAKAVATVSVLSGGRVSLGAGLGWLREEYEQLGREFRTRGKRLDEMIEVLRKVWAGGMVEHHGAYYDFDPLQLSPSPRARIPIYVGGASEPALRRAATLADGWLGSGNTPDQLETILSRLTLLRKQAGRDGQPFEAIVAITVPPAPDLLRRLEDQGATAVVSYPLAYTIGPGTSVAQKRQALEQFGEQVIARS
jgi:probable F420-dependent oxidoreductase